MGVHFAGLGGAIVGGITSEAIARVVLIARGRRFLGSPDLAHVLDWPFLGRIALAAALACAPAWTVRLALGRGVRMVVASMAVYGAAYLAFRFLLLKKPRARLVPAPLAVG
jgi:hypothetical protein